MINNVPFVRNPDEWHCIHAAMKGVLEHFARRHYSLDYLNALMNSRHNLWVWPIQAAKVLSEEGLFVRLFTGMDLKSFKPEFIRSSFPSYADLTDYSTLSDGISYVLEKGIYEKRNLSISEIERLIYDGCVPIVILGSKKHLGKYVTLTGFDSNNFYFHDSGPLKPQPHRKISKEKFLRKWSEAPSLNSVIVVFGKEYNGSYIRFHFSNT